VEAGNPKGKHGRRFLDGMRVGNSPFKKRPRRNEHRSQTGSLENGVKLAIVKEKRLLDCHCSLLARFSGKKGIVEEGTDFRDGKRKLKKSSTRV